MSINNPNGMADLSSREPPLNRPEEKTNQGEVTFFLELTARRTAQNDCRMVANCRVGDTCRAKWELQLYTDPCAADRRNLKILLSLLACDRQIIHVEFSLRIQDDWSEEYSTDFEIFSCFGKSIQVADGERIQCKGKYYWEEAVDGADSLASNLELLFEEQLHSDVTLKSRGERLRAHKAILSARSPVFKAMFQHQYKERKSGNVDVEDVDPEVLQEMLRFMYTGKEPENMPEMSERLLPAADKYQLDDLKMMCAQHMIHNLTVDNVVRILILADKHSVENVRTKAQQFIKQHKAYVLFTKEWTDIFFSHPAVAVQTVQYISF